VKDLELLLIFMTALWVAFSGAIMPGPLLTITIEEAATNGWKAAIFLIVGHAILELILIACLYFGFASLLADELFIRVVRGLGGVFLLWMGYAMVKGAYAGTSMPDLEAKASSVGFRPVMQGIVTSLSNPYWILWWATIGAGFVVGALNKGTIALTSFYFGHISGDFIWYGLITFLVYGGKKFVADRFYRNTILTCGLFLMILAVSFIFDIPLF
jgi:threonine/homoserine/homoserine lactone efflux protein